MRHTRDSERGEDENEDEEPIWNIIERDFRVIDHIRIQCDLIIGIIGKVSKISIQLRESRQFFKTVI